MVKKLQNKLYDSSKIDKNKLLFTNKDLKLLLIPLIVEQLLNSLMGMADTMMVSNVGSAAISAVSLVDSINILVIQIFAALAVGGTVICSQYLGRGEKEHCNEAAQQVFLTVLVISASCTVSFIGCKRWLLSLIFGKVDAQVMANSLSYFSITVLSYPFLALFSVGSAFYRVSGNSRFPMRISVISNGLNIVGNAILIFGLHMGVVGAALATLLSRIFCCVVIFYYLRKPCQPIVVEKYFSIRPDFSLIRKILAIGIPAGIENGMFQFGKLAIQSTVSMMGTMAIAAQAMTNMLESVNGIGGIGIGIGLMTVVGQCIGAGRKEEAKYYTIKLMGYAQITIVLSCLITMLLTKPIMYLAGMETESAKLCFNMMLAITIVKPIIWIYSFVPAYGMRAAGDVKFSMLVSTGSMWIFRVALCIFLVKVWGFGPFSVWIGMFTDWTVRGMLFMMRFFSGKWANKQLI
ncbi:MATE family efflux transporter [Sporanaerobium hydrogeniformans]|uniref:MATE family efflux transporter n=1 Tax=Sporanaerobium hydrogeniformans TaxID=3072179 RepID=A0AC61DB81_9FIRM|nr:MATE family efflux transporter [Sporanaerobium hydrogeniformans]PHV69906.1 MATE family efflux transporter [Sporanaerobium hydrogeniformans]